MLNAEIDRSSRAYIEGWNSSYNAYTGGNPYLHRAGEKDWQAGRSEALKHFGIN